MTQLAKLSFKPLWFALPLFHVIILGLVTSASAVVQDFGHYTVDIPGSWTIKRVESVLVLISPDKEAIFFITQNLSENHHRQAIAVLSKKIKPRTQSYQKRISTLTVLREQRVVVTIVGDHLDRAKTFRSFKGK